MVGDALSESYNIGNGLISFRAEESSGTAMSRLSI
jgi:hypothetical protein